MIRTQLIFLILLIFAAFSVDADFDSDEELSLWLMNYYLNPELQKVAPAIKYLVSTQELESGNGMPGILGFLSGIIKSADEKQLRELRMDLKDLEGQYVSMFALAHWYSGLENAKKLTYDLLEDHPQIKNELKFLYTGDPILITQMPLQNGAWVLDMLWGNFMATGNNEPVERIISALAWNDIKGEVELLIIAKSAQWSLTSNATQLPGVLEICKQQIAKQPEAIAHVLKEIVFEVEKSMQTKDQE